MFRLNSLKATAKASVITMFASSTFADVFTNSYWGKATQHATTGLLTLAIAYSDYCQQDPNNRPMSSVSTFREFLRADGLAVGITSVNIAAWTGVLTTAFGFNASSAIKIVSFAIAANAATAAYVLDHNNRMDNQRPALRG